MKRIIIYALLVMVFLTSCEDDPGFIYTDGVYTYRLGADGNSLVLDDISYFYYQTVETIVIPDHFWDLPVTAIGTDAFGSVNVETLYIPEHITYLEDSAFSGLFNAGKVIFDANIRKLSLDVFNDANIGTLEISSDTVEEIIESKTDYSGNVRKIDMSQSGIKAIGDNAFKNASELEEIILPEQLETIGDNAFSNTSINSLKLPGSLTSVGSKILGDPDRQITVYVPWKQNDPVPEGWNKEEWNGYMTSANSNISLVYLDEEAGI